MSSLLFTSESVTEGHPDKVCDAISDAILDNLLAQDPNSRVACETLATTGLIVVSGEVTTKGQINVEEIVKETLTEIGYVDPAFGMDSLNVKVQSYLDSQSPEIAQGVDSDDIDNGSSATTSANTTLIVNGAASAWSGTTVVGGTGTDTVNISQVAADTTVTLGSSVTGVEYFNIT